MLAQEDNKRSLRVLYKDVADIVQDPLLLEVQGKLPAGSKIVRSGLWAEEKKGDPSVLLARKYAGKFGLFQDSPVIKETDALSAWAEPLHAALLEAFSDWTRRAGIGVDELLVERALNARVYEPIGPSRAEAARFLGDTLSAMRELIMKTQIRLRFRPNERNSQSEQAKMDFVREANESGSVGIESNCGAFQTWKADFQERISDWVFGTLSPADGSSQPLGRALLLRAQDGSLQCYTVESKAVPIQNNERLGVELDDCRWSCVAEDASSERPEGSPRL